MLTDDIRLDGSGPILLVDDDRLDTEIVERFFQRSSLASDYELKTFESGPVFLGYMNRVLVDEAAFPSIVMIDINMPEMNGFEVLEELRSNREFVTLPAVVFVSNSDLASDIERARRLNAAFQEKFSDIEEGVAFFDRLARSRQ